MDSSRKIIRPKSKSGPLFISKYFKDAKDPCIVRGPDYWHIYGSGGSVKKEEWQILHATAPALTGPWTEQEPARLLGLGGPHVAAPSVVYNPINKLYHMAIQRDFTAIGGGIEYLVSSDGHVFTHMKTILDPADGGGEAGLYDPHFSLIRSEKYMVYSGIPALMTYDRPFVPQPDIYLAKSESNLWPGPWKRVKKILDHADIAWHHNHKEHADYEWGIEGPQLYELPNGKVLLNATCFITEGRRGTRQRVFFAVGDTPEGPYTSFGPVLTDRDEAWESGENGHATVEVQDDTLYLFYQARSMKKTDPTNNNWMYGLAQFSVDDIQSV